MRKYVIHDFDANTTYILPKSSKTYQLILKKNEVIKRIFHMKKGETIVIDDQLTDASSSKLFRFVQRHIKENAFSLDVEKCYNMIIIRWRKPCTKAP